MIHNRMALGIVSIMVTLLLASCSYIKGEDGEDPSLAAKTAIQYATLKVIDDDPEKADKVIDIAGKVRDMIDPDRVEPTITLLDPIEERVRDEVNWNSLEGAQQVVVSSLIDAARNEIERRINAQEIDPDNRVAVINVLDWIEQAAKRVNDDTAPA